MRGYPAWPCCGLRVTCPVCLGNFRNENFLDLLDLFVPATRYTHSKWFTKAQLMDMEVLIDHWAEKQALSYLGLTPRWWRRRRSPSLVFSRSFSCNVFMDRELFASFRLKFLLEYFLNILAVGISLEVPLEICFAVSVATMFENIFRYCAHGMSFRDIQNFSGLPHQTYSGVSFRVPFMISTGVIVNIFRVVLPVICFSVFHRLSFVVVSKISCCDFLRFPLQIFPVHSKNPCQKMACYSFGSLEISRLELRKNIRETTSGSSEEIPR